MFSFLKKIITPFNNNSKLKYDYYLNYDLYDTVYKKDIYWYKNNAFDGGRLTKEEGFKKYKLSDIL